MTDTHYEVKLEGMLVDDGALTIEAAIHIANRVAQENAGEHVSVDFYDDFQSGICDVTGLDFERWDTQEHIGTWFYDDEERKMFTYNRELQAWEAV